MLNFFTKTNQILSKKFVIQNNTLLLSSKFLNNVYKSKFATNAKSPKQQKPLNEANPDYQNLSEEDFENLIKEPVNRLMRPLISPEELESLENHLRKTKASKFERKYENMKEMSIKYGKNFDMMYNTKYIMEIDALKDKKIQRNISHLRYDNLNDYRFERGFDYEVLKRKDDFEHIKSLNIIELNRDIIKNKLKYNIDDHEHFAKYEPENYIEDYLKNKPDNFLIVQNLAPVTTTEECYNLLSPFGKIINFKMRRNVHNGPAFFEVTYSNQAECQNAIQGLQGKRLHDQVLYLKTNKDADYEDPINRTVVFANLDPRWELDDILNTLSDFGNIMHFEIPIEMKNSKPPTREELMKYLKEHKKYNKEDMRKVDIKEVQILSDIDLPKPITQSNENIFANENDTRPIYDLKRISQDNAHMFAQRLMLSNKKNYAKYEDELLKDYKEEYHVGNPSIFYVKDNEISTQVDNIKSQSIAQIKSRDDEITLPHFLKQIDEVSFGSNNQGILTMQQRISLTNQYDQPMETNKGYCFITFASTDEAKLAIIQCQTTIFEHGSLITCLKKDSNHMEWDVAYFLKTLEKMKNKSKEFTEKLIDEKIKVENESMVETELQKFRKDVWGDDYEKALLERPVVKSEVKDYEGFDKAVNEYTTTQEQALHDIKVKTIQDLHLHVEKQSFSKTGSFEANLSDDEEDINATIGRSFNSEITARDLRRFKKTIVSDDPAKYGQKEIENAKNESVSNSNLVNQYEKLLTAQKDLKLNDGINKADMPAYENLKKKLKEYNIHDLKMEVNNMRDLLDRSFTKKRRLDILYRNRENEAKERIPDSHLNSIELIIKKKLEREKKEKDKEKEKEKRKLREQRLENMKANKEANKETNKQDSFFDPFDNYQHLKKEAENEYKNNEESYKQKAEKYRQFMDRLFGEGFKEKEIQYVYEKYIDMETGKKKAYFEVEQDKNGKQFITKEDMERFKQDCLSEDPIKRADQLEKYKDIEEKNALIQPNDLEDFNLWIKHSSVLATGLFAKGILIETYKFKPSEQYQNIEELLNGLNNSSDVYTYEKHVNQYGEEVVAKFLRRKYKYDLQKFIDNDPEKFEKESREYLLNNGIPESYLNAQDANEVENLEEIETKVKDLLSKKYGFDFIKLLMSDNPIPDQKEFAQEIEEQQQMLTSQEFLRVLTKEDFVNYVTKDGFTIKKEDGKYYEPKYKTP